MSTLFNPSGLKIIDWLLGNALRFLASLFRLSGLVGLSVSKLAPIVLYVDGLSYAEDRGPVAGASEEATFMW